MGMIGFLRSYGAMWKDFSACTKARGDVIPEIVGWLTVYWKNLVAAVLAVLVLLLVVAIWRKLRLPRELESSWPMFSDGIVFGRRFGRWIFSPTDDEGHVGVFSGTGTGKTYTVGVPTLQRWRGTAFVIDISGDICRKVKGRKLVFDIEDPTSLPYNVFADIDQMESDNAKLEGLRKLSLLVMPDPLHFGSGAERFFHEGGRKIFTASLIAGYFSGEDFIPICRRTANSAWRDLFEWIDDSGNAEARAYINEFEGQKDADISGCKSNCDRAIDLFAHSEVLQQIVRRPHDGEDYIIPSKVEGTSIYCCVPDVDLKYYSPLVNIITAQIMQYISGRKASRKTRQILLFLDEFSSFRLAADVVLEALQKYRKKRCRVMIMTQNIADLNRLYGNDTARSLLSNMAFKVLLGGLDDPESARYFADIIGYRKARRISYGTTEAGGHLTIGPTSRSTTTSENREYVIEPADLDRIGRQKMILLHKSIRPFSFLKLRKTHRLR